MFSNSSASPVRHSAKPGVMDFSRRACLRELMDEPATYQELRECLRDLGHVNRTTLAYRPTLDWLRKLNKDGSASRPLHIVDVGSGGGDLLRIVERWAARRGMSTRLTGIDRNPLATRAARSYRFHEFHSLAHRRHLRAKSRFRTHRRRHKLTFYSSSGRLRDREVCRVDGDGCETRMVRQ